MCVASGGSPRQSSFKSKNGKKKKEKEDKSKGTSKLAAVDISAPAVNQKSSSPVSSGGLLFVLLTCAVHDGAIWTCLSNSFHSYTMMHVHLYMYLDVHKLQINCACTVMYTNTYMLMHIQI